MIEKFNLTKNERARNKNIAKVNEYLSQLMKKVKSDKNYNLNNDPDFILILNHFGVLKDKCIELIKKDYCNKQEFAILVNNNRYHKAIGTKLWSYYQNNMTTDKLYQYEEIGRAHV